MDTGTRHNNVHGKYRDDGDRGHERAVYVNDEKRHGHRETEIEKVEPAREIIVYTIYV